MGFWAWFFPGPAERAGKARRAIERGDPSRALLELEGLEGDEVEALRAQAADRLVALNLELLASAAEAGQLEAAADHLALAERFAQARHAQELREHRRILREARSALRAQGGAPDPQACGAGHGSCASGSCGPRGPVPHEDPSPGFGADPVFSLPPDHPQVRYALLLEGWPEALRARLLALGPELASAVLRLEDGDAQGAWDALEPFAAREPAARLPRAQAALALGQHARAASELRSFAEACGHQRVGPVHSAALLARALAADRRPEEALELLEAVRRGDEDLELLAAEVSLHEALGRLPEADRLGIELLRRAPGDFGAYKLVARIRVRGGERQAAMQVLESGLSRLCRGPGKCGSRPLDLDAARLLAQLYLEDGLELRRAEDLLGQIARAGGEPAWIDGYLGLLAARARGEPLRPEAIEALLRPLPPEDPRRALVQRHLQA